MVASILNTICEQRRKDVAAAKQTVPLCRLRIAMISVAAYVGLHVACLRACSGSRRLRGDEGARARRTAHWPQAQVPLEELKGKIDAANKEFPAIDFKARLREVCARGSRVDRGVIERLASCDVYASVPVSNPMCRMQSLALQWLRRSSAHRHQKATSRQASWPVSKGPSMRRLAAQASPCSPNLRGSR